MLTRFIVHWAQGQVSLSGGAQLATVVAVAPWRAVRDSDRHPSAEEDGAACAEEAFRRSEEACSDPRAPVAVPLAVSCLRDLLTRKTSWQYERVGRVLETRQTAFPSRAAMKREGVPPGEVVPPCPPVGVAYPPHWRGGSGFGASCLHPLYHPRT